MPSYTTPVFVQEELRLTTPFSSTTTPSINTINRWIEEESALIDNRTGTSWFYDEKVEYFDYNGEDKIILRYSPLVNIIKVEYNTKPLGVTPVWVQKTEGVDFVVYPEQGVILLTNKWSPSTGFRNIKITYNAGFTDVPVIIQKLATKLVALRVLNSAIEQNINERNDGGSISVGSISIVEPASYGINSYKELKNDINTLWNEVIGEFKVFRYG